MSILSSVRDVALGMGWTFLHSPPWSAENTILCICGSMKCVDGWISLAWRTLMSLFRLSIIYWWLRVDLFRRNFCYINTNSQTMGHFQDKVLPGDLWGLLHYYRYAAASSLPRDIRNKIKVILFTVCQMTDLNWSYCFSSDEHASIVIVSMLAHI